jgi:hypothetical protein
MNEAGKNIWVMEIAEGIMMVYYRDFSLLKIKNEEGFTISELEEVNAMTLQEFEVLVDQTKAKYNKYSQEKSPAGATGGFSIHK